MHGKVSEILHKLEIVNITNKSATDFIAALRKDVNRLMPEDFVGKFYEERTVV